MQGYLYTFERGGELAGTNAWIKLLKKHVPGGASVGERVDTPPEPDHRHLPEDGMVAAERLGRELAKLDQIFESPPKGFFDNAHWALGQWRAYLRAVLTRPQLCFYPGTMRSFLAEGCGEDLEVFVRGRRAFLDGPLPSIEEVLQARLTLPEGYWPGFATWVLVGLVERDHPDQPGPPWPDLADLEGQANNTKNHRLRGLLERALGSEQSDYPLILHPKETSK
jgi:hypothetical protein